MDYQGESRQYVQEGNTLLITFVFALIVIFLVLAAQFESYRDPFIILIALPTSMFGAMLPLNILGFLGAGEHEHLFGDRPRHADRPHFEARHSDGRIRQQAAGDRRAVAGAQAIEQAAGVRLRPILMTTAAMVVAMIPLIIAEGRRRAQPLRHRRRDRLRHEHRHAVHALRHAGDLYARRARSQQGAAGKAEASAQAPADMQGSAPGRAAAE